jgi:acyl-CoA synthetase (NDP forming)
VLKVQSADIPHKASVGAIRAGVTETDVETRYEQMLAEVGRRAPHAIVDGVLVQALAPPGLEMLVGISRSPSGFPPLLTVGLGGFATEIHADTRSTILPVTRDDVLELVRELRSAPLIFGYRGGAPLDAAALIELIMRLARAYEVLGSDRLQEIELNPVRVYEEGGGALALDFLAVWSDPSEAT